MKKLISKKVRMSDDQMRGVISSLQGSTEAFVIEGQGAQPDENLESSITGNMCPP